MAKTNFPGPYVNSTEKDDTIMEYVPMDTTSIGARPSGLPKGDITSGGMGLDHVSNRAIGSVVSNKFPK